MVESELTGTPYRDAFVAGLDEIPAEGVEHVLIIQERPDARLTYLELHRPYFDVASLRWVDATRIRVMRMPLGGG